MAEQTKKGPSLSGGSDSRPRQKDRVLYLFSRCNTAIVTATDENALLTELCRIAVEEAGYLLTWVGRGEHDAERTVRMVTYAGPAEWLRNVRVTWADEPHGGGVAGTAIRTRTFCVVQDVQRDPSFAVWRDLVSDHHLGSVIGVPIFVGSEIYGAWLIYASEPNAFDEAESQLLAQLGVNISHGMTVLRAREEQTRAERVAGQLLDRLRRAQAAGHVGMWELDLSSGRMWASEEAFRIYGVLPTEDQTLSLRDVQARARAEHRPILDRALRDLVSGARPYDVEYTIERADSGERRFIHSRAELARDEHLQPARVVGTIQDITNRKRLELELLQAQKMESIGRLAGGVAHDFNNLLTVIQSYADLLHEQVGPKSPLAIDIQEIRTAALRAADLTRQLLAFSRKQVLEPRIVNVSEIVANAERMLRRLIGEDIALEVVMTKDLGNVFADRGQIEQVIMNLAVNARDAMPLGGKLTIETQNVVFDAERTAEHLDVAPGPYVLLAVTDTGEGMDAATRDRIFEPFFTTKKERGTGLGLSTVYGIVRQSGGHIWVYSEVGRGTTFKIYLPRLTDADAEPAGRVASERPPAGNETILVVEDNEQVRRLVCSILARAGYRVLCANDSLHALDLARDHEGAIDLLLTDVVMPLLTGPELAKRLLATRPTTKVLYMSGYTDNAIVHQGVLDAGIAFLPKPLSPTALLGKVREVLERE